MNYNWWLFDTGLHIHHLSWDCGPGNPLVIWHLALQHDCHIDDPIHVLGLCDFPSRCGRWIAASLFQEGNCFLCSGNTVAMVRTLQANMKSSRANSAVEMFTGGWLKKRGVPTHKAHRTHGRTCTM